MPRITATNTHPNVKGENVHNDFPSTNPGIKGGDRIAMELFGFPDMYIFPYKDVQKRQK